MINTYIVVSFFVFFNIFAFSAVVAAAFIAILFVLSRDARRMRKSLDIVFFDPIFFCCCHVRGQSPNSEVRTISWGSPEPLNARDKKMDAVKNAPFGEITALPGENIEREVSVLFLSVPFIILRCVCVKFMRARVCIRA